MAQQSITIQRDTSPIRRRPWLVRWYGEYNPGTHKQKRHCRSFARRKEAEQFAKIKEKQFDNGMLRDERTITLEEFGEKFLRCRRMEISPV